MVEQNILNLHGNDEDKERRNIATFRMTDSQFEEVHCIFPLAHNKQVFSICLQLILHIQVYISFCMTCNLLILFYIY